MPSQNSITHGTNSATLADVLERVLDKGLVIAGDIKVKLVDIELLTIQIRLVVCSVEKAVEMGMDWWVTDPNLSSLGRKKAPAALPEPTPGLEDRLNRLEEKLDVLTKGR